QVRHHPLRPRHLQGAGQVTGSHKRHPESRDRLPDRKGVQPMGHGPTDLGLKDAPVRRGPDRAGDGVGRLSRGRGGRATEGRDRQEGGEPQRTDAVVAGAFITGSLIAEAWSAPRYTWIVGRPLTGGASVLSVSALMMLTRIRWPALNPLAVGSRSIVSYATSPLASGFTSALKSRCHGSPRLFHAGWATARCEPRSMPSLM